ncbi:MAG TPA: FHA domain-containing protein [Blastocatellia bacterium]|jgi:tetratricopeptide (TPR) repeat protein|nr:FHA domain-containing protein [Blastocatellia bacterium]
MNVRGEIHLAPANGASEVVHLESPRFTIGRGAENSLCVPATVVSRSHAELIRVGANYLLRDLGSTNGSFVNGDRVTERMLNDGDTLRFGSGGPEMIFRLIETDGAAASPLPRHEDSTTDNLIHSLTAQLRIPPADVSEEANLRRVLAETHLNKGDFDRALEVMAKYNDATNIITLPLPFRASVLLCLGRIYLERKQLDLAIDALGRSLNIYNQLSEGKGDDTGIAGAHASLGRAMLNSGDFLMARDHLHRALLQARRAGNMKLRAEVHYLLGKVDWKEADFEGANYNWGRAARMAEETSDAMLRGRVQMQQALILYTEGKLREAIPAYQAAIQQLEYTGNVRLSLKAYSSLSRVWTRLGSWSMTEKLMEDRLRIAREHKLAKAEAVALTDLAELKLLQGNLLAAEQAIEKSLNRHGQTVYARTQRILGRILLARRRYAEAIEALEKGLAAARASQAIEEQALIGFELAQALAEDGDLAKAREQLEAAEATTSLDPALNLMARALYSRGVIHARTQESSEANRCFGQSLSIFQTIGDPYRAALCHEAIGVLRMSQLRNESARAHMEEARGAFARLGSMIELNRLETRLGSSELSGVQAAMTNVLSNAMNGAMNGTAPLSLEHKTLIMALPAMPKILVAVASEDLAILLKRGLEVENYIVDRAQDGREALQSAMAPVSSYQLLILDALLEHKSGFDICREMRKNKRETPVILLGGRQGVEDKIEALQSGADDFLSKRNLVFEELMAKIEALLR